MSGFSMFLKVILRIRWLQYRGSFVVYNVLRLLGRLYKSIFIFSRDVIVPTLWGAVFRLPKTRSYASESRYLTLMLGLVEPQWRDYFDKYIVNSQIFIDIGAAGDAYYTIKACKSNPRIRVIAVEPLAQEYRYMLLNISQNKCDQNVLPVNMALCREEGLIDISNQKIRCTTLDTLVAKLSLNRVDMLKIDVEGAGREIIEGGIKTIASHEPIIFFEVHNNSERIAVKRLEKAGYKVIKRYGEMYILLPKKVHKNL
jgi:precorrin-6B methylase 2